VTKVDMRVNCFVALILSLGLDYFVGAHLAELVNRETFNLYACFGRRHIDMERASQGVLHLLVFKGLILSGTTSVTLVRTDQATEYLDGIVSKNEQRNDERNRGRKRVLLDSFPDNRQLKRLNALCEVAQEEEGHNNCHQNDHIYEYFHFGSPTTR
jgi:hypothetical protein